MSAGGVVLDPFLGSGTTALGRPQAGAALHRHRAESGIRRHSPVTAGTGTRTLKTVRRPCESDWWMWTGRNFPNLALMKLSAWHKLRGDTVEFADPGAGRYDKVYLSKVFTHTPDCRDEYYCEVIRGGTGYRDYTTTLPEAGRTYVSGLLALRRRRSLRLPHARMPEPMPVVRSTVQGGRYPGPMPTSKSSLPDASGPCCSTTTCWPPHGASLRSRRSSA